MSAHLSHRQAGYNLLHGHGLEIGALHQPALIPSHCTIEYGDAHSREEIIQYFPELNRNDNATGLFLSRTETNHFEYFSIWRKS